MKLQVTQENLNKALSSVSRVASSRSTLPILANVLIKTNNNLLSISATNLNIAITHSIGAKVATKGSITVPAKLMQEFIASLPAGVIDLELDGTKLKISTEKYNSTINGIISDDYPIMPSVDSKNNWKISSLVLKSALSQVIFASSSDETRPILTGILFSVVDDNLYLVATDSYRLAEKKVIKLQQPLNLLIPASSMTDLLRILPDNDNEVLVTYDDNQIKFKINEIELLTRLLNGTYPDYKKLIPEKFSTSSTLKKADMLNVVKVSSLFARENAGSIKIEVNEENSTLSVKSIASQIGENIASAEAVVVNSGDITLNARYLLEALNALSGENIEFAFNGKLEPTIIRDPKKTDYNHIIMPLKS